MASTIMHMAVANQLYKKINSTLNINYYDYILGTISPDISKHLGENKIKSHFLDNSRGIPNIDNFLKKYQSTLTNSFNLGYFIHLYTDRLFYRDYYPLFIKDDFFTSIVKRLDGDIVKISKADKTKMLYNDYSNLNPLLIDQYTLNLDIFYTDYNPPETNIDEIPIEKLKLLIDDAGILIQNLSKDKEYIIDITSIKSFIDDCVEEIYAKLQSINLI